MNETLTIINLDSCIEGVLVRLTNVAIDDLYDAIDDVIEEDEMTDDVAASIMTRLRTIDPTESGFAAEIRDYLRNNTDVEGI